MRFFSVLAKIGKAAFFGLQVAQPVLQQVGRVIPGSDPYEKLSGIIGDAEAIGEIVKRQGGTPLDKLNETLPLVQKQLALYETLRGNELVDEKLFTEGASEIVGGIVKVKKAFKPKT